MSPKYIVSLGLLLIFGSFMYDIVYIGIPYQDPTPEMIGQRNQQIAFKNLVLWTGLVLVIAGSIWSFWKRLRNK